MGMYDTYVGEEKGEEVQVQLKAGPCSLNVYKVGDYVDCENKLDGTYLGYYGFVSFKDNYIVAVNGYLKNSNGDCAVKAQEIIEYNSEFYRYLYGNHEIDKREKKVKSIIEKFKKDLVKRRKKANGKSRKSKSK